MVGVVVRAQGPVDQPTPAGAARPTTTLAVFGDTDFASNPNFLSFSNGDLFLNVMNYVTGDRGIDIGSPQARSLSRDGHDSARVQLRALHRLVPAAELLVTIAGFIAWWRRR